MRYAVENIPLWSVTIWDKNFSGVDKDWQKKTIKYKYLLSDELDSLNKGGDVRLLYTGKEIGYTSEELAGDALCEGEVVSIPWGGTPSVKYYKGKFVTGDNRIATSSRPDELLNKYLYYLLRGRLCELASYYRGAGLKHPSMKDVLKMSISYPEVSEQIKVIRQFELLEIIIEHRLQQLTALDDLIKARFVEMFGDPDVNPMSWPEKLLSEMLDVLGGYAFKSDGFSETDGIPVLRIGNINAGFFKPVNMVFWEEDENLNRYIMYPGDLVMSLTGTVGKDDYGNVCILGSEYAKYYLNQRNAKLELKQELEKHYLSQLMRFEKIKKRLTGISRGVRQANISNKDILNLKIPVPPIELQQQFASFVAQIDKSKAVIQKSLDETQLLFDSLMQKYFG